ncbi:TnpV protein [Blautia schinkii]|nr:TnpV protein [Blautia schinkii]
MSLILHLQYNTLLLEGELVKYLNEVDDTANQRMELRTMQIKELQGVNEALKDCDQMAWVGAMNNIRNAAEEIVLTFFRYMTLQKSC